MESIVEKQKTNKIIYFDKETIKNILQEEYKGSKVITSGKKTELDGNITLSLNTSVDSELIWEQAISYSTT